MGRNWLRAPLLAVLLGLLPGVAFGLQVSGTVVDDANNPVADATVRVQTHAVSARSGLDGSFDLVDPSVAFDAEFPPLVTAGREGFIIGRAFVGSDGQTDLQNRPGNAAPG